MQNEARKDSDDGRGVHCRGRGGSSFHRRKAQILTHCVTLKVSRSTGLSRRIQHTAREYMVRDRPRTCCTVLQRQRILPLVHTFLLGCREESPILRSSRERFLDQYNRLPSCNPCF